MKKDDGEIGKEIERNRMAAFEFWQIESIAYCLGTETTDPNSKKRGRDTQDEDEEELAEQVEIVLADGMVVWN